LIRIKARSASSWPRSRCLIDCWVRSQTVKHRPAAHGGGARRTKGHD